MYKLTKVVKGKFVGYDKTSEKDFYNFLRNSIYSNCIPLTKPVGFYFSYGGLELGNVLERNTAIIDNNIELTNMNTLILLNPIKSSSDIYISEELKGKIFSDEMKIECNSKEAFIVSPRQYILTTVPDCTNIKLCLLTKTGCGRFTTEESSRYCKNFSKEDSNRAKNFTPIRTTFTLEPYIKILPYTGKEINIRFEGVSEENFNMMWQRYVQNM